MPKSDFSQPYTDEELAEVKTAFCKLPTYTSGGWICAKDIPALITAMGYERTPEQVEAYVTYWEKHCAGIVTWEAFVDSAKALHNTALYARDYALKFDKNGDNSISRDEFKELMKLLEKHEPKLAAIPYETFVEEADTNKDGRVDIAECTKWIENHI